MKKTVLSAFVVVALITGTTYAQKTKNATTEKLATEMVDKLVTEITLTKEQKKVLQKKSEEFVLKLQEANSFSDKKQLLELQRKAFEEYNSSVDSTFTVQQKTQREKNAKERETLENTK
jgi:hypothetical protein